MFNSKLGKGSVCRDVRLQLWLVSGVSVCPRSVEAGRPRAGKLGFGKVGFRGGLRKNHSAHDGFPLSF